MEAIDKEAELPSAGTEVERLEAELEAGLGVVRRPREERGAAGARQMQQLWESRGIEYGVVHASKRQYMGHRASGREEKSKGEKDPRREFLEVAPVVLPK